MTQTFAIAVWTAALVAGACGLWLERDRVLAHMPHFVAAWKWSKGRRLHILAAVFTGGEAILMCGIPLPYADALDVHIRLLVIGAIVAAAYWLKWRANEEEPDA